MPSFTTICRAVVLVVVGAIVVKGWQLYGPPAEQVKSAVVSAIDMAETAIKNAGSHGQSQAASNSAGTAPKFDSTTQMPPAGSLSLPAATLTPPPASALSTVPISTTTAPSPPELAPITAETTGATATQQDDRIAPLLSRLEQLGGADPKLSPWGSSGNLYRFCCRAAVGDSSSYTRHFEAVAAQPEAAVSQVVAKVEAWRSSRSQDSVLR